MHDAKRLLLNLVLLALAAAHAPVLGQSGPNVPCAGCSELAFSPPPETGLWNNPLDPTGTGFMLEFQGTLTGSFPSQFKLRVAGFHFAYDESGAPVWFLVSGALQPGAEDSEVAWVLESDLTRFSGGPCVNCPSTPASVDGSGGALRIEFLARNIARFRIDDGAYENIVPMTFGVISEQVFPTVSDYRLPDLAGRWDLVFESARFFPPTPIWGESVAVIMERLDDADEGVAEAVRYELRRLPPLEMAGSTPEEIGVLECATNDSEGPRCTFLFSEEIVPELPMEFRAPLPNVGHGRIIAESENGFVVNAFRLRHD